jgi:hypothetical protein
MTNLRSPTYARLILSLTLSIGYYGGDSPPELGLAAEVVDADEHRLLVAAAQHNTPTR